MGRTCGPAAKGRHCSGAPLGTARPVIEQSQVRRRRRRRMEVFASCEGCAMCSHMPDGSGQRLANPLQRLFSN